MKNDQRKTHRYQVPAERSHAVLLSGKRQIAANLMDQSAGGFCVTIGKNEDIHAGEEWLLQTLDGKYQVRVQHVFEAGENKKLGLSWVECFSGREPKTGVWATLVSILIPRRRRDSMALAATALVLFVVGAMAVVYYVPMGPLANDISLRLSLPWAIRSHGDGLDPDSISTDQLVPLRIKGKLTPEVQEQFGELLSLLSPQASRDMQLTRTQRSNLKRILEATTEELVTLYDLSSHTEDAWHDESSKVIDEAMREVYQELTTPQRSQLPREGN
jgi:hypothetical protein